MKLSLYLILLIGMTSFHTYGQANSKSISEAYISQYASFYPSKALLLGKHENIYQYEDRSKENIKQWIEFNQKLLKEIPESSETTFISEKINLRLLKMQIREELRIWDEEKPHWFSPDMYVGLIEAALQPIFQKDFLTRYEVLELICSRTSAINRLSLSARSQLKKSGQVEIDKSINKLNSSILFLENDLFAKIDKNEINKVCQDIDLQIKNLVKELKTMFDFMENNLMVDPNEKNSMLGKEKYALRLYNYTDQNITPDQLAEMALQEIRDVKDLILKVSTSYVKEKYGKDALPTTSEEIIKMAFADMEKDAPVDGADYLAFWEELAEAATNFLQEKRIATLPEIPTLRIINAPESAGAAARIGWVSSAPPFDPNPVTTLYLPSIPDTFPEKERTDFWSSFNKPFNRMIVIHELIPGHYMQIKVSRETPHPVRLWFPYGPYFEGWASFTEEVVLDAGWEKERPLTYLAHLRKRLENANRAYMSVMVHCNGWTQEQVMEFSTETSLLAPQFAKSLWGRLMRSPMQITSYFLGGREFRDLLKHEKERQGDKFDLQLFMDTIIKTGPIPIEDFSLVFGG